MGSIYVAHNWRVLLNTVPNFWAPLNVGNFLTAEILASRIGLYSMEMVS